MAAREAERCGSSPMPCLSHDSVYGTAPTEAEFVGFDLALIRSRGGAHASLDTVAHVDANVMLSSSGGRGADPTASRSARARHQLD
jgi:hypothetical protein